MSNKFIPKDPSYTLTVFHYHMEYLAAFLLTVANSLVLATMYRYH